VAARITIHRRVAWMDTDAAGIAYLAAAGQRAFGENRVQDAAEKLDELPRQLRRAIEVHLIGHLQGNKVRAAVAAFDLVQSVDSLRLATALGGAAAAAGRRLPVLVQVNVAGDPAKGGFGVDQLLAASEALLAVAALEVRGLMTIGPAVQDAEAARPTFRALRELREGLAGAWPAEALRQLSMGMSGDYEVAVEEGASFSSYSTAGAGIVGDTLELGGIQDLVSQTRLGASGYVYLVDSNGGPVAYPSPATFKQRSLALPQVRKALASSSNAGSTAGRNLRRQKVLSAWATVQPVGWRIFVEQPESEAFAPIASSPNV